MDRKIKTRQVHKDIKVLDKTATVTDHVKQSYVRTKETVMQSTEKSSDRENNPVGYAEDTASEYADRIFHETGHLVRRQAGKIIERKKEKASVSSASEETVYQLKEQIRPVPSSGGETAQKQGKELAVKKIKTIERDKRTIKTGRASEQVVKNTGKGIIKTSEKAVKTAEQTAKTSIKTSEQTANASVRAMHYSMKKAEKAVQTARQTARDTTIAVKKTAKAVTHAIKALIEATKALLNALTAGGWIAVMILIIVILFGGFLCMTGGDNSSTVSSVSAEVEAYEPLIRQYANQYGIGEYVELIKAIMMQESGGRGLDPMQCSEGSFNTKYPKQPNGITDPEYSISCGVQEIKSCLERAGVKNPLDMENIKLALQSYNYGNATFLWVIIVNQQFCQCTLARTRFTNKSCFLSSFCRKGNVMENFIHGHHRLSIRAGLCGLITKRNMVISNGVIFSIEYILCLLKLWCIQYLLQCRNFIVELGHGRQETEGFQ